MSFNFKIETAAGITEVTQGEPETPTGRLNRLAKEAGLDDISTYRLEDFDWGEQTSTTVTLNIDSQEAFSLSPTVTGRFRQYTRPGVHQVPSDFRGLVGIHRAMIGYVAASRISSVPSLLEKIGPIIDQGVKDLINQFGDLSRGYKISMAKRGYENSYFRDLENMAAFEIRLVLTKEA